ncbi:unnamed protein product [Gordionus sp. m RMFG-2023]
MPVNEPKQKQCQTLINIKSDLCYKHFIRLIFPSTFGDFWSRNSPFITCSVLLIVTLTYAVSCIDAIRIFKIANKPMYGRNNMYSNSNIYTDKLFLKNSPKIVVPRPNINAYYNDKLYVTASLWPFNDTNMSEDIEGNHIKSSPLYINTILSSLKSHFARITFWGREMVRESAFKTQALVNANTTSSYFKIENRITSKHSGRISLFNKNSTRSDIHPFSKSRRYKKDIRSNYPYPIVPYRPYFTNFPYLISATLFSNYNGQLDAHNSAHLKRVTRNKYYFQNRNRRRSRQTSLIFKTSPPSPKINLPSVILPPKSNLQHNIGSPKKDSMISPLSSDQLKASDDEKDYSYNKPSLGDNMHVMANAYLNFTWPNKKVSQADGDIMLGGLMMIHEREEQLVCGLVMPQGGVQALEVMLYTLDYVNEKSNLLPGFKLGYYILDDCDKDTYGLEQSVDFIKGSISSIDDKEYKCADGSVPEGSQMKMISGVVGAPSSVTSIQVANLLRLFKIPQISFFSTSPELSNKERFEYFSRTVPSDEYQALAMIELIKLFNWSYISVIYEESNYGERAFTVIEEQLDRNHICIAVKEKLTKDSGVAKENQYDVIVRKLLQKSNAKGVIIYGSDQEVGMLMAAVRRQRATGKFMWIGSDGWSARDIVTAGREAEVEGTVSVQPLANPIAAFQDHFLNLTVAEHGRRDPWLYEVWEKYFECRFPNTDKTYENQIWNRKLCTGKESMRSLLPPYGNIKMEDQLQFVSDAVLAFAYAFSDMHKDLCGGVPGLCEKMDPPSGPLTLNYIRKVKFTGLSGDNFEFLPNGDGPPRYNILHFKQVAPGIYKWVKVGKYVDKVLKVNLSEIRYHWDSPSPPESVCSKPCNRGEAKRVQGDNKCCWLCVACSPYQILVPTVTLATAHTSNPFITPSAGQNGIEELHTSSINVTSLIINATSINANNTYNNGTSQIPPYVIESTHCVDCELGFLPEPLYLNRCLPIPDVYMSYSNPLAMGALCFSCMGMICALFVLGIFIRFCQTPVVKASGRELSFALLIGIICCYGVTILLVAKPASSALCGVTFVCVGIFFSLCYAAILTKTNRIARIFNSGKRTSKRPTLISPKSQICICSLLVAVQLAIMVVKLVMTPPRAIHNYPTRTISQLVCSTSLDSSYLICLAYPLLLILVCTVYAVLTRKIPEAFNESKYIGFTMYTTCIIWLAFVPIYIITANNIPLRITTICVSVSLSATTALCCLFTHKLYIIILHPERNVRQTMMTGATKYGGTKSANNTTGGMGTGGGTSSQLLSSTTNQTQPPIPLHVANQHNLISMSALSAATATTPISTYSRIDSGTQSDDLELTNKLRGADSMTSCYSSSNKSSTGTQTIFEDNSDEEENASEQENGEDVEGEKEGEIERISGSENEETGPLNGIDVDLFSTAEDLRRRKSSTKNGIPYLKSGMAPSSDKKDRKRSSTSVYKYGELLQGDVQL